MSDDRAFFNHFMMILGALVAITVVIFFLARYVHQNTQARYVREDPFAQQLLEEQISPVGSVAVAGAGEVAEEVVAVIETSEPEAPTVVEETAAEAQATPAEAPAAAEEVVAAAAGGAATFQAACVACHGLGIAGAPKLGDAAEWAARTEQGIDVLYEHAIQGYQGSAGVMPAKGGRIDLSDDAVRAAVDYMISESQ